MRIVHLSDTHLGFSAYRALDKNLGINQREADINKAFAQVIDKILALKPQAVLHSGDLFDSVRPSNRIISFALEQLLRLAKEGIPVVMIAGNHSSPRMRDTGSIFRLFELFENLYPIYKGRYEVVALKGAPDGAPLNGLTVHAIPQCPTKEDFHRQLQKLPSRLPTPDSRLNVLMLHAGIAEIKEFSMGEFNEQIVPLSYLKKSWDYVALGHYHRFAQVAENAYYSGSTERLSFSEANQEKGFLEIRLGQTKEVKFHPLKVRPMVDLTLNLKGCDAEVATEKIEETLRNPAIDPAKGGGKIIRLTLENLSQPAYNTLDFPRLRKLTESCVHFELRCDRLEAPNLKEFEVLNPKIGGLLTEWTNYLKSLDSDLARPAKGGGTRNSELLKLGLNYLQNQEE